MFPDLSTQWVLSFKALGGLVGPSTRSANIRYRKERTDKTGHPVVGICYVVKEIEPVLTVQLPGGEIGRNLPEVGIKLMCTLELEEWTQPTG